MGGVEVSAGRHKSACRLPLHGRSAERTKTSPSNLWLGRAALVAGMQYMLWLLGSRDADLSLCSGLLAAMPRDGVWVADWREDFGR